jgi:hypothetical protein
MTHVSVHWGHLRRHYVNDVFTTCVGYLAHLTEGRAKERR